MSTGTPGHMVAESDETQDHHLASLVYVAAREGRLKTIKSLLGPRLVVKAFPAVGRANVTQCTK